MGLWVDVQRGDTPTEWLTPHIRTLRTGSLARRTSTFCWTKCFFLVFLLDASLLRAVGGEDMVALPPTWLRVSEVSGFRSVDGVLFM